MERIKQKMKNGYERQRRRDIIALVVLCELEENLQYNFNSISLFGEYEEGMEAAYKEVFNVINIMKERFSHE